MPNKLDENIVEQLLTDQQDDFIQTTEYKESELVQIPTSDPQAALRFCQTLAKTLTTKSNGVVIAAGETETLSQEPSPAISVVIPVFDEEDNLPVLYQRLTEVLEDVEPLHEFIFVDDGSRDSSVQILEGLAEFDPHLIIVQLMFNPEQ